MAKFQESEVKKTIRLLIKNACEVLQRQELTYLGLPAENATDIKVLGNLLKNVICIDDQKTTLEETRRSIAGMRLKERRFIVANMWEYLRDCYQSESLTADVTFLDFLGGGIRDENPFAYEIAGLRNYFVKHAHNQNKAFVLAWTYMPRDKGTEPYHALDKLLSKDDISFLHKTKGIQFRSVAIRLLLRQLIQEHNMSVKIVQHAVYKNVMNTIILIFSKGIDTKCTAALDSPESLISEPCYIYKVDSLTPESVPLFNI